MKTFLSKIFLTTWLSIQSLFGLNHSTPIEQSAPVFGANFNPTGGQTYRLQSSISSTQTTITLSSFKEPVSNIPYTMSYLNSDIQYGTIDPQNNTTKEFISFTGITQNADGTATLTGVTRGLGFSYPYTASTTLRQPHSGQAIFILSNPPQLYEQYGNKNNAQTISGLWSFTTNPYGNSIATSTNQLITKGYADGLVASGVATSTEGQFGGVWLSSQLNMASSTHNSLAPTVLYSKYSTSSPYTSGLWVPITRNDGKLSPLFIATTSSDNYVWGGTSTFNGTSLFTASTTLTATTSIAATNATNNALIINNLAYAFPSSRGSSGTFLTENGSGTLSWSNLVPRYTYASTSPVASVSNGYATSTTNFVIPALNASSTIKFRGSFTCDNSSNGDKNCTVSLRKNTGEIISEGAVGSDGAVSATYSFDIDVSSAVNNGSNLWSGIGSGIQTGGVPSSATVANGFQVSYSSATSLSSPATLVVVVNSSGAGTTMSINSYSIIVNP